MAVYTKEKVAKCRAPVLELLIKVCFWSIFFTISLVMPSVVVRPVEEILLMQTYIYSYDLMRVF